MGENTHVKFCAGAKACHLVPWALDVRPRGQHTSTEECFDEGRRAPGRVVVENETRKEETSDETTCTKHLTDSVGEVVELVDGKGNMLIGEVTISPVGCDLRRSLLVRVFKTGEAV